jgi:hypothetical protein
MDLSWLLLALVLMLATFGLVELCDRSRDSS